MIRDKDKIYGEPNDPNTVIIPNDLVKNKYVVGADNRDIKTFNPGAKKIITTDINGNVSSFSYNQPNKLIGLDASGKLELVSQAPVVPPTGRELIIDTSLGTYYIVQTVLLEPFYWYEVEVIGAGGGGGAGVGRWHIGPNAAGTFLDGMKGGDGAYVKTLFKLTALTEATLKIGLGGKYGSGAKWNMQNGVPYEYPVTLASHNRGGEGGRTPYGDVDTPVEPNNGQHPVYQYNGTISPLIKYGGAGVNGGANGGDSEITLGNVNAVGPSDVQGVGGGGGGANGPYGGNGGKSDYRNTVGFPRSCSGGGGGAGAGSAPGGDGGGLSPSTPEGIGGGAGGSGVFISPCAEYPNGSYALSSGGGGGGGAAIFEWATNLIICGGGGGGAGAGYGGSKYSTPGENGISNQEGFTAAGNGGLGGVGCNFYDLAEGQFKGCNGSNGGKAIIRLWRCV